MNKLKDYFLSNRYGWAIFLILMVFMMSNPQRTLDVDCLCSYTIDYHTGFGGRKLIASMVSLFTTVLNPSRLLKLVTLISIVACAFFSYCCNIFIKSQTCRGRIFQLSSVYLTTLYLLCPASIFFLLKYPNFGRLDIFLYLACLLFCFLFYHRERNRLFYFMSVAVLMVLCILAHHIFILTYMPFFVALFIYDIWGKGFDRKLFFCHAGLGIVVIASFLSIFLFSSMNISLDEAIVYRPDVELSRKFVWFIYYAHIPDHVHFYVMANIRKLVAVFFLTLLFLAPLFYLGWKVWRDTLLGMDRRTRSLFWAMQASFLLLVPAFCIAVDHARWFAAFLFSQFLLIAYFSFDRHSLYANVAETMGNFVRRHLFFAACLVIYCSLLGRFGSDNALMCIEFILDKLHIYKVVVEPPI